MVELQHSQEQSTEHFRLVSCPKTLIPAGQRQFRTIQVDSLRSRQALLQSTFLLSEESQKDPYLTIYTPGWEREGEKKGEQDQVRGDRRSPGVQKNEWK